MDGEAAISAITTLKPDVALLDIGMPKANGYDVALTGWGQDSDKRRRSTSGRRDDRFRHCGVIGSRSMTSTGAPSRSVGTMLLTLLP